MATILPVLTRELGGLGRNRGQTGPFQGPFDEEVKRLARGEGVDALLEFVSTNEALLHSPPSLKRAGRLVLAGYQPDVGLQVMPYNIVRQEIDILGSRASTRQELQETVDLVSRGRIKVVVERVFSFEGVESASDGLLA